MGSAGDPHLSGKDSAGEITRVSFAELGAVGKWHDAILATNTSSLPVGRKTERGFYEYQARGAGGGGAPGTATTAGEGRR